jgi:hypothetical protein
MRSHFLAAASLAAFFIGGAASLRAADDPPVATDPKIKLMLTLGIEEYDPTKPSKAIVKFTLKNEREQAVRVSAFYDRATLFLQGSGGRFPLTLNRAPTPEPKATIEVKPGEERVLFTLPLDEILYNGQDPVKPQRGLWSWDWIARPAPPLSPIHEMRGKGFVAETTFWAVVVIDGKRFESPRVKLNVKQPKPNPPAPSLRGRGELPFWHCFIAWVSPSLNATN